VRVLAGEGDGEAEHPRAAVHALVVREEEYCLVAKLFRGERVERIAGYKGT
jgi:hypothetical protein